MVYGVGVFVLMVVLMVVTPSVPFRSRVLVDAVEARWRVCSCGRLCCVLRCSAIRLSLYFLTLGNPRDVYFESDVGNNAKGYEDKCPVGVLVKVGGESLLVVAEIVADVSKDGRPNTCT